ncbi:MAG: nitroreductase family protein [Myxococcales bacterium]|nr:nitroreductase family protein [Myxococcales bacterium]
MRLDDRRYPPTRFARFVVDGDKCNACQKCVETCPGQLLEMAGELPVNKHDTGKSALGCIGCKNCYAVCPESAIDIRGFYQVEGGFYQTQLRSPALPNPFGEPESPAFEALEPRLTPVEKVIYTRRSNRLYKKKKVPEELLRRVVEAGRFAPSQGNSQPWSFVVISDRDLIDRIGAECARRVAPVSKLYLESGDKKRSVFKTLAVNALARLTPNNFDQRLAHGIDTVVSGEKWDMFLHAPTLILVLGDKRSIGDPLIDAVLAAHNMVLTAHSLGLGTCYVGFVKMLNTLPELRRELGIVWPYKVMTSIAIGFPRTRTDKAVARERPKVTWFPADRSGPRQE